LFTNTLLLMKMSGKEEEIKKNALDFQNTENAFAHKINSELKDSLRLFSLMNNPTIVGFGNKFAVKAIEWHLPFARYAIQKTLFKQFCGGTTLLNTNDTIKMLAKHNVKTVLDYGVEAKETEEDFNSTMVENMRAIDFAAREGTIPFIVIKITGMARMNLLIRIQSNAPLTLDEQNEYFNASKRIDAVCFHAREKNMSILIDAEESWIQDAIDRIANSMMSRYNKERAIVYNTFQMYRHDRLDFLKKSFETAVEKNYFLGAKLVRGAYMEKERKRAAEMNYPTPINPDKFATDTQYNNALSFCVQHYVRIACINATHNAQSSMLLADLIEEMGISRQHPHFYFSQLYGMSDNISFNLAKAGYNVAKYVVYGAVEDVVPYLTRRAQENTSITGDMSRELALLRTEAKRRKA
jgi:proline dehydrogenase